MIQLRNKAYHGRWGGEGGSDKDIYPYLNGVDGEELRVWSSYIKANLSVDAKISIRGWYRGNDNGPQSLSHLSFVVILSEDRTVVILIQDGDVDGNEDLGDFVKEIKEDLLKEFHK